MRYRVAYTEVVDPDITSPEWQRAEEGRVDVNMWSEFLPAPTTRFRLLRGPLGISLLMHTEETHLRAVCERQNGDIYLDSCMEMFFKPNNLDTRYLNFEINPKGFLHLGLGDGRRGRTLLEVDRAIFNIVSLANEGDWTVKLYIPYSFLNEIFGKVSRVARANFYKCGDGTDHVHFGTWSPVEVEKPDFHQPDFFGMIEF